GVSDAGTPAECVYELPHRASGRLGEHHSARCIEHPHARPGIRSRRNVEVFEKASAGDTSRDLHPGFSTADAARRDDRLDAIAGCAEREQGDGAVRTAAFQYRKRIEPALR